MNVHLEKFRACSLLAKLSAATVGLVGLWPCGLVGFNRSVQCRRLFCELLGRFL